MFTWTLAYFEIQNGKLYSKDTIQSYDDNNKKILGWE